MGLSERSDAILSRRSNMYIKNVGGGGGGGLGTFYLESLTGTSQT